MLEAYQALAREMETKRSSEFAPERRTEEKRAQEAVTAAAAVDPEGIDREIGSLNREAEDIAQKTVEGTSQAKSLADLQKLIIEQGRKMADKIVRATKARATGKPVDRPNWNRRRILRSSSADLRYQRYSSARLRPFVNVMLNSDQERFD